MAPFTPAGELVLLADQDHSSWNQELIAEGQEILRGCLRRNQPGPYQLQAAINAVHSDAATAADTDWSQIVQIYDHLLAVAPGPVVALNRAVALAEVDGPGVALALLDELDLDGYHVYHAARGELLARLGQPQLAAAAYEDAIAATANDAERASLQRRRSALTPRPQPRTRDGMSILASS